MIFLFGRSLLLVASFSWIFLLPGCSTSHNFPTSFETFQRLPLKTVEVNGNRIAYLEVGKGAPLILIHGFGGSMWNWEHQQNHLSEHYRVYTLDLLGSGLSDKPDIDYSPNRLMQFFLSFMDVLGIQQATLVGNSMGAGLAMGLAMSAPERVKNLILIGGLAPNPQKSVASPTYKRFLNHRPPLWLAKVGNWLGGRWATETMLTEIVYDPSLLTPWVIERSYHNRQNARFLEPLYSQLDYIPQWNQDFAPRIRDIHHPTLILWGDQDRVFPISVGREIHTLISSSIFHAIPDAGHIPQWEQPELVNTHILKFLAASS